MRKVLFQENEVQKEGLFHQWGMLSREGLMYSVAIIELPNGTITTKNPWEIKFVCNGTTK